MQRMPFFAGLAAGVLVGAVLSVWLVLPDQRAAKSGFVFDASVEEVWDVFTDPASQASWRADVVRVEMVRDNGWRQWIEYPQRGPAIQFTETRVERLKTYALDMTAENAFTGKYQAVFEARDDNTTLGVFTETVTLQGFMPKLMSYLFVNQREFTRTYCLNAQAEIERRRDAAP